MRCARRSRTNASLLLPPTHAGCTGVPKKRHSVTLSLQQYDGRFFLVCQDTGVGMTLRHYSGSLACFRCFASSRRQATRTAVPTAWLRVGTDRTVWNWKLSHFLLADEVEIQTRRAVEAGRGWTWLAIYDDRYRGLRRTNDEFSISRHLRCLDLATRSSKNSTAGGAD